MASNGGFARRLSLVFAAGSVGGLANSAAVWACGRLGFAEAAGVKMAPAFTAAWLYPRVVWGGIWGVLFLLPFLRKGPFLRALVFSLSPTAVQLFVIFPMRDNKGMMGLDLGTLTPLFVIGYNAVWGLSAAVWLVIVGERR